MNRPPDGFCAHHAPLLAGPATTLIERAGVTFVCKRLSPRMVRDPEAQRRFAGEAAILRALGGRGAPRLVEAGADDAGPFVVMEHLALPTLRARMRAVDAAWLARATRSAYAALDAVHEAADARGPLAIVHGDLSPDNVLVSDDGDGAKLVDFELARWRDDPPRQDDAFRGTLLYAAPELARGEPIDRRADYFALAATLLHVWSGAPPRARAADAALLVAAAEESVSPWAEEATRGLEKAARSVLLACLAFDRDARPARAPCGT